MGPETNNSKINVIPHTLQGPFQQIHFTVDPAYKNYTPLEYNHKGEKLLQDFLNEETY